MFRAVLVSRISRMKGSSRNYNSRKVSFPRPPWGKSTDRLRLSVMRHVIHLLCLRNSEQKHEIVRGKCPTMALFFGAPTPNGSSRLPNSRSHQRTSPSLGLLINVKPTRAAIYNNISNDIFLGNTLPCTWYTLKRGARETKNANKTEISDSRN
jgi:hypothetical protein